MNQTPALWKAAFSAAYPFFSPLDGLSGHHLFTVPFVYSWQALLWLRTGVDSPWAHTSHQLGLGPQWGAAALSFTCRCCCSGELGPHLSAETSVFTWWESARGNVIVCLQFIYCLVWAPQI